MTEPTGQLDLAGTLHPATPAGRGDQLALPMGTGSLALPAGETVTVTVGRRRVQQGTMDLKGASDAT